MSFWVQVVVPTPVHSGMGETLSYRSERALPAGSLVRVPLGKRTLLGLVWSCGEHPPEGVDPAQMRDVLACLDALAPLDADWRQLVQFSARYYQRSLGETALAALPPALRDILPEQLDRKLKRIQAAPRSASRGAKATALALRPTQASADPGDEASVGVNAAPGSDAADRLGAQPDSLEPGSPCAESSPEPSAEQVAVLAGLDEGLALSLRSGRPPLPVLLFGSTGSGKTEVYLRAAEKVLAEPCAGAAHQVLVMVPEINLTPQLEARFRARFEPLYGPNAVVCMHSGTTPAQRLSAWLLAHSGRARIVLGTRMAVFASLPGLRLILVDEEHDPSYKSQDGSRYSARDLAVYRARERSQVLADAGQTGRCQVVLGSATPSLESWHAADQGRYQRLHMPSRIGGGRLPRLRLVDMNLQPKAAVVAPSLLAAMGERIARGEQSLVLLNRRGYAPVLACHACGWKSGCPHCSAFRVFHKLDRSLRCHHCGLSERVPRACPDCGNLDISPVGRGTEQIEEQLSASLVEYRRPNGDAPRVARMDADTTRNKGSLEAQLATMHSGEVDVLVGTQMIAKGHDFRRITLVASLNADSGLFASDYRAPERLFALLMQAAGRAGRDAAHSEASEMWVQTWHPTHPLFDALRKHDYPHFAASQLEERQGAAMPPFGHQALVRADARQQAAAQAYLNAAAAAGADAAAELGVTLYPAIPQPLQRVANIERAQLLVEAPTRGQLQRFLSGWQTDLLRCRHLPEAKGLLRFAVDVDPLGV